MQPRWLIGHRHEILRLAKSLAEELKEPREQADHPCFYPGCEGTVTLLLQQEGERISWSCSFCNNEGVLCLSPQWWRSPEIPEAIEEPENS